MVERKNNSIEETSKRVFYIVSILLGVVFNLIVMIAVYNMAREISLLLIVFVIPLPTTLVYCLIASNYLPRKMIISPIYVMVGNLFSAPIVTSLITLTKYAEISGYAIDEVINQLPSVILFYFI